MDWGEAKMNMDCGNGQGLAMGARVGLIEG